MGSDGEKDLKNKSRIAYICSLISIVIACLCACGDIYYGQNEVSDELVEIFEDEEQIAENPDTGISNSSMASEKDASEVIGSDGENAKADQGDIAVEVTAEPESDETDEVYYGETDATIVPHGSLYPEGFDVDAIPEYSGKKYVFINDNEPYFTKNDMSTEAFEYYSALDGLGRCGTAYANICPELMPTERRGDISEIHPTGWKQKRYDGIVDADPPYLYNRSHLIAYKLAGENANVYNLITGTRYFNAEGMSYVEDRVYQYVKDTGNHVLYRITPVFFDDELVARGVLMEAKSVENDKICYCEFVYNVQPGIYIDYADGSNKIQ